MDRIVADERLTERLAIRLSPVEVVCPDGQLIGTFTPNIQLPEGCEWGEGGEPTLEQVEETANSPGPWYTTEEVIAHLRRLG